MIIFMCKLQILSNINTTITKKINRYKILFKHFVKSVTCTKYVIRKKSYFKDKTKKREKKYD